MIDPDRMWDGKTTLERFWEKVQKTDLCWLWTGAVDQGYGKFKAGGRIQNAHRAAWELLVGPVPDGFHVDHLCRNTRCVNPAHLEPVTCAENQHRGKGAKLSIEIARAIRASEESHAALGRRYGVHPVTIDRVRRGERYRESE